ncbi:hypothetical protein [Flavobacteriaceae bacterium 14752]|uniref:hypothetical protein n=1 Tax=Mesohalobacter salilacus TaxID=2491711 RepID=UPI000F62E435|nr:hypothetical protein EIG84_10495 [Flavobacteriaceae bacterium 14752]
MLYFNTLSKDFRQLYMVNSILGIVVSSCLGSIAAMLILMQSITTLTIIHLTWIVIVCMVYNAAVLVHFKPKWVFRLQFISVMSSFLTIMYFILF